MHPLFRGPNHHSLSCLDGRVVVVSACALTLIGCVSAFPLPRGARLSAVLEPRGAVSVDRSDELGERLGGSDEIQASQPLTYDGAALAAVALHPELRAARAQRGVGRAQIVQAGILPNPQASGGLDVPTDGPTVGTSVPYSVELSWALSPLVSVGAAVDAEHRGLEAIELDIAWQEWQVAAGARLGVVRLFHLARRLEIARQTEQTMAGQVETLAAAVTAGNATVLELAAAQSTLQGASLAVLQLVQAQRAARIEWLAVLGLPPTSDIQLAADPAVPDHHELPGLQALLAALPDARLDLAGLRRAYDAQEGRARAAALGAFPAISVAIRRTSDTGQLGMVGFGVTVDLPFFDRNQGQIALETATRDQLHEAYLARVQQARSEVARAHADLRSVREQRALVEGWLPTLEQLVDTSGQLVGGGNVSVVDLYDLRLRLLNVQLLAAELRQTELELTVALELASGAPWRSQEEAR